ncbi:MAG: DUF2341 domain-containing protein, partial [Fibrobacteria bacterium]|nr:DUF2341 domain-containing protein [Fibrobacteria bacterium]
GSDRATAYSTSNKIITANGKIFASWLDHDMKVRIKTYDIATKTWGSAVVLGTAEDNHGGPALTMDSQGYLYAVFGPHHGIFKLRRSTQPYQADKWQSLPDFGSYATYPSLICTPDDKLHIVYRGGSGVRKLIYQNRSKEGKWSAIKSIVSINTYSRYSQFGGILHVTPDSVLHLGFHIYYGYQGDGPQRGLSVGYLRSKDDGASWQNIDGDSITLPAIPTSNCYVEKSDTENLRIVGMALDPDKKPWVLVGRMATIPNSAALWHHNGDEWVSVELLPFVQKQYPGYGIFGGTMTFDKQGTLYISASILKGENFFDPTNEVVLMTTTDKGKSFEFTGASHMSETVNNNLPNIECPFNADLLDGPPGLMYLNGGGVNPPGKVQFVKFLTLTPFLSLSDSLLQNTDTVGNVVGTLHANYVDEDSIVFSLPEGSEDNSSFVLDSNLLRTKHPVNYNVQNIYKILVRAVWEDTNVIEQEFTLTVQENGDYSAWTYSMPVVLNTTSSGADVSGKVEMFPVLVQLNSSNFDFSQAATGGKDIRFSMGSGKLLPFEIAHWDSGAGKAEIWVLVDTVLGNDDSQHFTMYWGKSNVLSSLSNSESVFDTEKGFTGVWHLNEDGNSLTGGYKDASGNNDHGTGRSGMTEESDQPSPVNIGQEFEGTTEEYIHLESSPFLDGAEALSVSFWCKIDQLTVNRGIFARGTVAKRSPWVLYAASTKNLRMWFETVDGGTNDGAVQTSVINQDEWYHVSFTWDGTEVLPYINAVAGTADSTHQSPLVNSDGANFIGVFSAGNRWDGMLDEMRTSRVARSADWIKLSYMNQKESQELVAFGKIVHAENSFDSRLKLTGNHNSLIAVYDLKGNKVTKVSIDDTKVNASFDRLQYYKQHLAPGVYIAVYGKIGEKTQTLVPKVFLVME